MKTSHLMAMMAGLALASASLAGPEPPAAMTTASPAPGAISAGIESGFFWLQDESKFAGSLRGDVSFSTGWGITVPLGYDFGNGFSAGISAGYYHADVHSVSISGGGRNLGNLGVGGDVALVPLMVNGSYKFPLVGNLSLYVGGGVGAVYGETNLNSLADSRADLTDHGWDLGFQAFTGLSYDVGAFSSLRLGYRFMHVFKSDDDHNGHSVELGVMVRF